MGPTLKNPDNLVNLPPFETAQNVATAWATDVAFLNKLDQLSKDGETNKLRLATDYDQDTSYLDHNRLQWIVLPRNKLPTENKIIVFLDQNIPRFNQDDKYIIWKCCHDFE